jgi:hypothetical protein
MSLKTIHTDLGNKWVKITGISEQLKKVLFDFEGDNLFGYVYIDHTAGVTLEVVRIFDIQDGVITYNESPPEKKIRVICRTEGIVTSESIHLLSEEEINEHKLTIPETISIYDRDDLTEFRKSEAFHEFRGDGYPDDIQVLLPPINGNSPEIIWARVESYENGKVQCQMLNQPNQNFGMNINDQITASIQSIKGDNYVVCELDNSSSEGNQPAKKVWWKFW